MGEFFPYRKSEVKLSRLFTLVALLWDLVGISSSSYELIYRLLGLFEAVLPGFEKYLGLFVTYVCRLPGLVGLNDISIFLAIIKMSERMDVVCKKPIVYGSMSFY